MKLPDGMAELANTILGQQRGWETSFNVPFWWDVWMGLDGCGTSPLKRLLEMFSPLTVEWLGLCTIPRDSSNRSIADVHAESHRFASQWRLGAVVHWSKRSQVTRRINCIMWWTPWNKPNSICNYLHLRVMTNTYIYMYIYVYIYVYIYIHTYIYKHISI